ncbi:MAG: hypothetical protein VB859_06355 [Planctomycetaceae bacterium]
MTRVFKRPTIACGLVLVLAVVSGCQSFNGSVLSLLRSKSDIRWTDKDNAAVRCLCLWQQAEGAWKDRPCRGFGGQIFFLDRTGAEPVAVNGDVRIHIFDDQGRLDGRAKPVHTFNFTDGAWNAFLVKTQFGPAYNIFIPYTRSGAAAAECSIRVRLSGAEIPTVFSEMAYIELEGVKTKNKATDPTAVAAVIKTEKTTPAGKKGFSSSSVLSPELEARLLALQARRPVAKKKTPARIDPPATAMPIADQPLGKARQLPVAPSFHPLSGSDARPAGYEHPLVPADDSSSDSADTGGDVSPPADVNVDRKPVATPRSDPFSQMIKNAESAKLSSAKKVNEPKALAADRAKKPNVLSPVLEARLLALQARMPVAKKRTPARIDPPSTARPIKPPTAGQTGDSRAPSTHPLSESDARTGAVARPMESVSKKQPITGRVELAAHRSDRFQQMINSAESAAARQDWDRAIRLAAEVHRALVEEKTSWPGNQPSPSDLVAGWEVERITASGGSREMRKRRIDSRVSDYLNASRRQQEIGRGSEARRLAMVGNLIAEKGGQQIQAVVRQVRQGTDEGEHSLAEGWSASARPVQAAPAAHPLGPLDGDR